MCGCLPKDVQQYWHVLKSELSYCPSRLTKLLPCHFHVEHVGQAVRVIIPDCKAFMQFVLGDNRDFGVLRAHISIWKSSSCDMSPRRGGPATWIVFCAAVSIPDLAYTNKVHLILSIQPNSVNQRRNDVKILNVSLSLCVRLSSPLLILHREELQPLPAVLGRSYGYTLGRSPWTATINTHIHTYRHFPSAN